MEDQYLFFYYFLPFFSFLPLLLLSKFLLLTHNRNHTNLPPSPLSFPIFGHFHLLRDPLHRVLHKLSLKYGPVFTLRFGSYPVLILSSPSTVEECFTKNDVSEDRPRLITRKIMKCDYTSIIAAPFGPYWRKLRRITTIELFSITRLSTYLDIRQDEIRSLIKTLFRESIDHDYFTKVGLRSKLQDMSFTIIMRIVSGKRNFGPELNDLKEEINFRDMITEILKVGSGSYRSDLFPFLRWIDFQGMKMTLSRIKAKRDAFLDENGKKDGVSNNKMIDAMLSLHESKPESYSDQILKGIMLTILLVCTDTSAVTIEWAMSLLLNHPHVLQKASTEVDEHVGQDHVIQEHELHKLRYLQNIVNETLRLFPTTPSSCHMSPRQIAP
ncbi:hypothetical protein OSB04_003012 [Centaurea solstitialis]|uniref:Cytochrome P450 n=1 Tax=Centaurea solstitialis TaxID=347529 RepID=A0AA38U6K1_9ASTR|nr:hypothetical protein OSB04_003012 [Centaurea solstitialis]